MSVNDRMKLSIEIKNQHPVELLDLAQSMMAMADEYRRFVLRHDAQLDADGVKLYIKEIRTGSIIAELVALAPYTLPFIEHADTVVEFATHLKTVYEWFIGKSNALTARDIDKTTLQNLSQILEPVAKDQASQLNMGAINIQGDVIIHLHLSATEANAAQNAIRRELDTRKEPVTGIHRDVVLYWAQARNQPDSKAGDRARIESVYPGDVKVRFANDALKTQMLYETAYPFSKNFVVDVAVETVDSRPVLYKVLEIHDVFDREP